MIVLASGMQWAGHRLPEDAMPKRKRRPYGSGTAKYVVNLTPDERGMLQQLVRSGQSPARRLTRARVLLKADEGLSDPAVAAAVDVGVATVHRIRQRCVEEGLEAALGERPRSGAPALLSGKAQAHLVAVACSTPPDERHRWTLRLLADRVVELKLAEHCSYETVRRVLKKTR
jgi:transposase